MGAGDVGPHAALPAVPTRSHLGQDRLQGRRNLGAGLLVVQGRVHAALHADVVDHLLPQALKVVWRHVLMQVRVCGREVSADQFPHARPTSLVATKRKPPASDA